MSSFSPSPHPILALPSPAAAAVLGSEKFLEVLTRRERIIRDEKADPFAKGWEPPIWRVCDALLGFPWVDPVWAERMRLHLGFSKRISILLINGGNRGGKSEYAAKRTSRILRMKAGARAWALHSKDQMSKDYQQPLFWKFLPSDLKTVKGIRSMTTYIAYKQQTGFSEGKFTLPTGSDCSFLNYTMDRTAVEGGNLDMIWPDELVPPDWVETMEFRIAEKDGWMVITFTPVDGYTETVQYFQDGAETTKSSICYLTPKDGGPPDAARALGLTEEELSEIIAAKNHKPKPRVCRVPLSRPQDCAAWLNGGTGQPECPAGREFDLVPRVMKCAGDGKRAVVFFHTADNPYGAPLNVWETMVGKSAEFIKERFYGVGTKLFAPRFPKFSRVHIVAPAEIPKEGMRTMWVDPASGRNFFMLWILTTADCTYVYREWPGSYYIPGVGVPGPWAMGNGGRNASGRQTQDGRMGPAQQEFGFGYRAYKMEVARLEGWKDWRDSQSSIVDSQGEGLSDDQVKAWDEFNGAEERIEAREIDSRFASTPKIENDRPMTLIESFLDWNLNFQPTPGDDINEGIRDINNALNYDTDREVDFFNRPKLYVSAECQNLIFALRVWRGADGERGATKDPIDCLRYYYRRGLIYTANEPEEAEAGPWMGREDRNTERNFY